MGNAESRESTSQAAVADGNRPSRAASTAVTTTTPPVEDVTPRSQSLSARPNGQNVEAGGIERGQQATEEATAQLGYWYLLKNGYNELVNLIIRPPRATYELDDLGPDKFPFAGREYMRVDFTVVNDRQQTLQCSHWRPVQDDIDGVTEFPCVVYLHGNSSCRVEALSVLRTCLSIGVTVVAFDCAGCGKSDGEYISLGYFERDDVSAVIDHLRSQGHVSTIGLWGRSMGAATALLHADRDPSMAGLVVDSAFTSLEQLVQEIVEHGRKEGYTIPGFLVKIVMKFIRSSVLKRANFDLRELAPIEHASISFVPALFVAAKRDDFIAPHHSQQLHAQYAGDKNIVIVAGDHNSVRPPFLLDSAGIFLQTALQVDGRLVPDLHPPHAGHRMPWSFDSPKANKLRMMDLNVAFSGRYAKLVPKETWSCQVCTFVNEPLQMQCEVCRAMYVPPTMPRRRRRQSASRPSGAVVGRLDRLSSGSNAASEESDDDDDHNDAEHEDDDDDHNDAEHEDDDDMLSAVAESQPNSMASDFSSQPPSSIDSDYSSSAYSSSAYASTNGAPSSVATSLAPSSVATSVAPNSTAVAPPESRATAL